MPVHVREWGAELAGEDAGAGAGAVVRPSSFQDTARLWRRRECRSILDGTGTGTGTAGSAFIVTAHHLDDQTETLLLKVLRGAHLSNLSFMKRKGAAHTIAIITAIIAITAITTTMTMHVVLASFLPYLSCASHLPQCPLTFLPPYRLCI